MKRFLLCALLLIGWNFLATPASASAQGYVYGLSSIGYEEDIHLIYGDSQTWLDYWSAMYYDPAIHGLLLTGPCGSSEQVLDERSDVGVALVPAYVDLYSLYWVYSRNYSVLGYHYVYDIYTGNFEYVFYTEACAATPPPVPTPTPTPTCDPFGPGGYGGEVVPCPTPTPTPTPTPPTLLVTSVGFTGDYEVKRFATGVSIDPNGSTPTWVRNGQGNDKNPVAYKKGVNPTAFASFSVSPPAQTNLSAIIQARRGNTVITTQNVTTTVTGNSITVTNIPISASALEPATEVKRKKYKFDWYISFDNGLNWRSMDKSGDHEIHWLYDAPLQPAFSNRAGQTFTGLYDEALNHSTGELGGGETDIAKVIARINRQLADDVKYKPNFDPVTINPLSIIAAGGSRAAICWDNALMLRGLLRSIGIEGDISFHWGGDPATGKRHYYYFLPSGSEPMATDTRVSLQVSRPYLGSPCSSTTDPKECVPKNPHFSYHATVAALGNSYDPSYGQFENAVSFIETVDVNGQIKRGNAANAHKVTRDSYGSDSFAYDSMHACNHRIDFYGTGLSSNFNFDTDGITDLTVMRPSTGEWITTNSSNGLTTIMIKEFQGSADSIAPGDYDGDGRIDPAIWLKDGGWLITLSSDGSDMSHYLATRDPADKAVPGDYDGDHVADIAQWRASDGMWIIRRSSDAAITYTQWGLSTDIPVPGDYDGDGKTDLAVWRGSEGYWYVLASATSTWITRNWGSSSLGDIPVPGDYDGDGINDFAVIRPSSGVWYSLDSSNNFEWRVQQGEVLNLGDFLVPGDYDGDGKTDAAVWRAIDGAWRIVNSRDGSISERQWGHISLGDIPIPSAYIAP